jgi:hypothetical protein
MGYIPRRQVNSALACMHTQVLPIGVTRVQRYSRARLAWVMAKSHVDVMLATWWSYAAWSCAFDCTARVLARFHVALVL